MKRKVSKKLKKQIERNSKVIPELTKYHLGRDREIRKRMGLKKKSEITYKKVA
tara:strand:- start:175 stop:333 length:159 start_codon:yes stop_codon:yes gene_type:complete